MITHIAEDLYAFPGWDVFDERRDKQTKQTGPPVRHALLATEPAVLEVIIVHCPGRLEEMARKPLPRVEKSRQT